MARTIAVVEDEPAIRDNYAELFRRAGYQVNTFATREDATAGFNLRLPDLVILDIGLGKEIDGGFELCRELRARSPALPIIFLSARDSDFDVVAGLRLGACRTSPPGLLRSFDAWMHSRNHLATKSCNAEHCNWTWTG